MIQTKQDLRRHIEADKRAMGFCAIGGGRNMLVEWLKGNLEDVWLMRFIICMRKFEYVSNNYKRYGAAGKLWYLWHKHRYHRKQVQMQIFIGPGAVGEGLHIVHPGFIRTGASASIGKRCTILPRVLIGKKRPGIDAPCVSIGDDCYIGTGATILGPVRIGNNVTIAAGVEVVHDVPDNAVVGGNPARILKMKQ